MKDRYFKSAPLLNSAFGPAVDRPKPHFIATFAQIARAVLQPRSSLLSFRQSQKAHAVVHPDEPMALARKAYMDQRYMNPLYRPPTYT